jgi:head-tail adaptor
VTAELKLSRQLVLEAREVQSDGSGGFAVGWTALGTVWADVRARAGREDFLAGRAVPRTRYLILVRGAPVGALSRPRPEQRFREGARVFDILTVAEHDAGGRFLEIVAEESVGP